MENNAVSPQDQIGHILEQERVMKFFQLVCMTYVQVQKRIFFITQIVCIMPRNRKENFREVIHFHYKCIWLIHVHVWPYPDHKNLLPKG